MLSWSQMHLAAAMEAERSFLDLSIDTSRRVDPFAALVASGVIVLRRPLDRLAGIYLPANGVLGSRPGVLVNVQHPTTKQRYTAAHELAHHRRDHELALDEETEWIARGEHPASDTERFAEAFAAWFLMPKRLVIGTLDKLGVPVDRLDAEGAYALSLEMGTSYAATVNHLADLRLVTSEHRAGLQRVQPQAVKRRLGALGVIRDSWRDVWMVRPLRQKREITAQEGDAVILEVPETPSSGSIWLPASVPGVLSLVSDEYRAQGGERSLGEHGVHQFVFRVEAAGQEVVRLELRRPWQHGAAPEDVSQLEITAETRPAPGIVEPHVLLPATA